MALGLDVADAVAAMDGLDWLRAKRAWSRVGVEFGRLVGCKGKNGMRWAGGVDVEGGRRGLGRGL